MFVRQNLCDRRAIIILCCVHTAIDEAVALFKKRKPSDRDTTQCRLPSLYAAEAVSMPSDEPSAFEFTVCCVEQTACVSWC